MATLTTPLYRELFVSHEDYLLEVVYVNGDKQLFTAPNVKTLEHIRNRINWHADDIVSMVISRPK